MLNVFVYRKGKSQAAVYVPDEPKEKLLCGSNAFTAISQATCCAAAQVKHVDIYEHVACLRHGEVGLKNSEILLLRNYFSKELHVEQFKIK